MYTKTVTIPTDWLSEIDGLSVKDAIAYLQGLPQEHILNCYMDRDTHGELVSELHYQVEMTDSEVYEQHEKRILKEIKHYEDAKEYYSKPGHRRPVGNGCIANCESQIAAYKARLEELKQKYGRTT